MKLNKFDTEIGKIYCKYNNETDSFDKIRIVNINSEHKIIYLKELDSVNHMVSDTIEKPIDEFNEYRKECTVLKSEGLLSVTNVISMQNESKNINDVILIYFPNNKITRVPEPNQPYIVARQGIENIFGQELYGNNIVGMSVSIDTLPDGYALSDFMFNQSVTSSRLTHVYKTDTEDELSILLDNDETTNILNSLYQHAVRFKKNTDVNYKHEDKADDCIDGYCNSLKRFMVESDFINDLYIKNGIICVDFAIEEAKPISDDDKIYISALVGGIHICKAVPTLFDYDINMDGIKMRYFLIIDINKKLWIVPYTISLNEIDADSIYRLNEEATIKLQNRLKETIKAYDKKSGIDSGSPSEMFDTNI